MSNIRIESDHAVLTLSQGFEALLDLEDVPRVVGRRWHAHVCHNGSVYGRTNIGYATPTLGRLILGDDLPPGGRCKYVDGNPLNCRRSNLKILAKSGRGERT